MGDRRPKKKPSRESAKPSEGRDVFADLGLNASDFDVASGGGKSFLTGQRIVWMTVTHRPTGRKVTGKIGTSKKGAERQHDSLLRSLLGSFRRS